MKKLTFNRIIDMLFYIALLSSASCFVMLKSCAWVTPVSAIEKFNPIVDHSEILSNPSDHDN